MGLLILKEILPILEERCIECHRKYVLNGKIKEPEAGLRLDGASHIMGVVMMVQLLSLITPVVVLYIKKSSSLVQIMILCPRRSTIFYRTRTIRKWIAKGDFGSRSVQRQPLTNLII